MQRLYHSQQHKSTKLLLFSIFEKFSNTRHQKTYLTKNAYSAQKTFFYSVRKKNFSKINPKTLDISKFTPHNSSISNSDFSLRESKSPSLQSVQWSTYAYGHFLFSGTHPKPRPTTANLNHRPKPTQPHQAHQKAAQQLHKNLLCGFSHFSQNQSTSHPRTQTQNHISHADLIRENNTKESEATVMQKQIKQNHPCHGKHDQWAKLKKSPKKKSSRRSFSSRSERCPFSQSSPTPTHHTKGFPPARETQKAPAIAAGLLRSALSAEGNLTIFQNRSGVLLNKPKLNIRPIYYRDSSKCISKITATLRVSSIC